MRWPCIPFPTDKLWRHRLSQLHDEGHLGFYSVCGFVGGMAKRAMEAKGYTGPKSYWDKLMDDLRLIEALKDDRRLSKSVNYIEREYYEVYGEVAGGAR